MAAVSTELVRELQRRHNTWPVATAALGRTATVAAMMGVMLKNEERLTIQIKGEGPLRGITVDADAHGNVRGFVTNPQVDLPLNSKGKLDVGAAVGPGMLYVIRDTGLKDFYKGSVELQTGEIAEDFTYYFVASEQTPSAVGAGVLVGSDDAVIVSGGFIVQLLPGHTEDDVIELERRLKELNSVTDVLKQGVSAEELLRLVLHNPTSIDTTPIAFSCNCSRDRIAAGIKALGRAELESLIAEQGEAEAVCHYCNEKYHFTKADLERLLSEAQSAE
jgi:molecular chaperone Hsp33